VERQIVGAETVDRMYASAAEDERHFHQLLSANCFGDHYTRRGIDIQTRELLTFAYLVALGGADPQVRSHVAANLNVGNGRGVLIAVITQLLPFIGYPADAQRARCDQRGRPRRRLTRRRRRRSAWRRSRRERPRVSLSCRAAAA
jgi:alkylhydroperoxidase/carboxymuconolactone decarboxylase family protein YurZ